MIKFKEPGATGQRILGICLGIAGIALSYALVWLPYRAMTNGDPSVSLDFKSVIAGPLLFSIGIGHIILGTRAPVWFGREKLTAFSVFFSFVLVGLSACVYFWLKSQAASMGYD